MAMSDGFPPIARADATVLILGSLPGQRSIDAGQYYAHPQNAFWKIMSSLYGIDGSYKERCARLIEHRIALWDVLASSVRPGSLDASIQTETAIANDFARFLAVHADICLIVFNGQKAQQLFRKFVRMEDEDGLLQHIACKVLPSTSPAYAAMPFTGKLSAWKTALDGASKTA
ncbi:MAG: DNA-deoxyinosine glycosylase [Proteobacteria bacterium]|nr:DNA-deoxyinosine glycosylase [Pseudomonadota bacterium]